MLTKLKPKVKIKTSTNVIIAASLMLAVSATAMFFSWGILTAVLLQKINTPPVAEKIICQSKKHIFFSPASNFNDPKKGEELLILKNNIDIQARIKKSEEFAKTPIKGKKNLGEMKNDFYAYHDQFVKLMRSNPREALNYIPEKETREEFMALAEGCFPEVFDGEGELEIYHADDFENKKSATEYYLHTDVGERYLVYFSQIDEYIESRTRVKFNGFKFNNELLIHSMDVLGQPGNPPVYGPQDTMALLFNINQISDYYDDVYRQNISTKEEISEMVFRSMNDFYKNDSYDAMEVSGKNGVAGSLADIYGPYDIEQHVQYFCSGTNIACNPINDSPCTTLPNSPACYEQLDNFEIIKEAVSKAADVDFSQYERVIFILPDFTLSYKGMGTLGRINVRLNNGETVPLSFAWVGGNDLDTALHEYGHNLGWNHANLWNCPLSETNASNCVWEYYDSYDVMGSSYISQSNAVNKEMLGWLPSQDNVHKIRRVPQEFEVVHQQTYMVKPIGDPSGGIEALKIYRGQDLQFPYLYIEYRKPTSLDGELDAFLKKQNLASDVFQGATIHTINPEGNDLFSSLLFDGKITENETPTTKALPYGESFYDQESCIRVTAGNPNENGLPITVDLGPRSDYEKPIIHEIRQAGIKDCVAEYEVTAEDESGISMVEFYLSPTTFQEPVFLGEDMSAPYTISINTLEYNQPYLTVRVYDNALASCNGTANNYSQFNDLKVVSPCGNGMRLNVYSPGMNAIVKNPVVFDIHANSPRGIGYFSLYIEVSWTDRRIGYKNFNEFTQEADFHYEVNGLYPGAYVGRIEMSSEDNSIYPLTYPFQFTVYPPECGDREDNDSDGFKDYWANSMNNDPGCVNRDDDSEETPFLRSDVDNSGVVSITDAITILRYLYLGDPETLICQDAADVDDDGLVNIGDAIYLLNYLYTGSNPPPLPPFEACGGDPTADSIGCFNFPICRRL